MREYETVIGLEVHCELATKTKIFCGCTTELAANRIPMSALSAQVCQVLCLF